MTAGALSRLGTRPRGSQRAPGSGPLRSWGERSASSWGSGSSRSFAKPLCARPGSQVWRGARSQGPRWGGRFLAVLCWVLVAAAKGPGPRPAVGPGCLLLTPRVGCAVEPVPEGGRMPFLGGMLPKPAPGEGSVAGRPRPHPFDIPVVTPLPCLSFPRTTTAPKYLQNT